MDKKKEEDLIIYIIIGFIASGMIYLFIRGGWYI